MKIRWTAAALVVPLVLGLQACGGGEAEPAEPCRGTFLWHAGSMPPPHSDNWELELADDGTGTYRHNASHVADGELLVEEGFAVEPDDAQALCDAARKAKRDDDRVGGQHIIWDLTGTKNSTSDPESVKTVTAAAAKIVGEERLRKGREAFEAWRETQK